MPDDNKTNDSNAQQAAPTPTSNTDSMKAVQSAPVLTKLEFSSDQNAKNAEKRDGNK